LSDDEHRPQWQKCCQRSWIHKFFTIFRSLWGLPSVITSDQSASNSSLFNLVNRIRRQSVIEYNRLCHLDLDRPTHTATFKKNARLVEPSKRTLVADGTFVSIPHVTIRGDPEARRPDTRRVTQE
jgi:hypothetical protein